MARTSILPHNAKPVKGVSYDYERKLYYVTVYLGQDAEGKGKKTTRTAKTLQEANEIKKTLEQEKKQGKGQTISRDTLVERTENLINFKALSLDETTISGYRNIYKNHILPYFKKKRIQEITVVDLRRYVTYLSKKRKLSPNTIVKHIQLLNQVFKEAYRDEIITVNPIDRLEAIKKKREEKSFFKPNELVEVLESVKGTQLEVPVFLAAFLGLRREEVAGLRWADVDFENRVINIVNARTQVGGRVIEKEPKTERSRRCVAIPEELHEVLVRARNKKPVRRDPKKSAPPKKYVAVMDDGRPFRPNYISDLFKAHIEEHGFKKVTFHGLRHTYASIANNAGTPMQEISASLGHASTSVTESVYAHDFNPVKVAAVAAVADSIGKAKKDLDADDSPSDS